MRNVDRCEQIRAEPSVDVPVASHRWMAATVSASPFGPAWG